MSCILSREQGMNCRSPHGIRLGRIQMCAGKVWGVVILFPLALPGITLLVTNSRAGLSSGELIGEMRSVHFCNFRV